MSKAQRRAFSRREAMSGSRRLPVRGFHLGRTPARLLEVCRGLVAAALIVGFSTPLLAVETFYVMFDNTMKGQKGACSVMTTKPTDAKYKMMGEYKTQAEADAAMKTMKECG